VRKFAVSFRPAAEADLLELYDHIAGEAGFSVAAAYIERIETTCVALESFPFRGRPRDEARPGIRTLSFERRATIVYRVRRSDVLIVRVLYGGRDLEHLLRSLSDE
jgi:toxin ParE1/3/4